MSEDICGCHTIGGGGATGMWWLETGDAAKHPTCPARCHSKEILSPNVSGAVVEKVLWGIPRAFMQREGSRYQKNFISSLPSLSLPQNIFINLSSHFPCSVSVPVGALDFLALTTISISSSCQHGGV